MTRSERFLAALSFLLALLPAATLRADTAAGGARARGHRHLLRSGGGRPVSLDGEHERPGGRRVDEGAERLHARGSGSHSGAQGASREDPGARQRRRQRSAGPARGRPLLLFQGRAGLRQQKALRARWPQGAGAAPRRSRKARPEREALVDRLLHAVARRDVRRLRRLRGRLRKQRAPRPRERDRKGAPGLDRPRTGRRGVLAARRALFRVTTGCRSSRRTRRRRTSTARASPSSMSSEATRTRSRRSSGRASRTESRFRKTIFRSWS